MRVKIDPTHPQPRSTCSDGFVEPSELVPDVLVDLPRHVAPGRLDRQLLTVATKHYKAVGYSIITVGHCRHATKIKLSFKS